MYYSKAFLIIFLVYGMTSATFAGAMQSAPVDSGAIGTSSPVVRSPNDSQFVGEGYIMIDPDREACEDSEAYEFEGLDVGRYLPSDEDPVQWTFSGNVVRVYVRSEVEPAADHSLNLCPRCAQQHAVASHKPMKLFDVKRRLDIAAVVGRCPHEMPWWQIKVES